MAYQTPSGQVEVQIAGLGHLTGLEYKGGVHQFCGIPYGRLSKRWTRATLADSWSNSRHDGTKLGSAAPNPPELMRATNNLTPVPQFPHLPIPQYRENDCLVMNIVRPPIRRLQKFPVMVYIHGGAFVYGGANRSVFDGVNLVSYSMEIGIPILSVAINYRVGLWGFLASRDIKDDLARDGFSGAGNFGISDQQLAFHWLRRYIGTLGGDPENITIVGESAGGTSVATHLLQNIQGESFYPALATSTGPGFHRAVQMSGGHCCIPVMPLNEHERQYRMLLRRLRIDPDEEGALEKLRAVPEQAVTECTIPLQGAMVSTYNPCDDGILYGPTSGDHKMSARPTFDNYQSPPSWLKSFMLGDDADEAVIFRLNEPCTFQMIEDGLHRFLVNKEVQEVMRLYELRPCLNSGELLKIFEQMASDAIFRSENYVMAHRSKIPQTFAYHFDEPSTLDNPLKGTAYHAIDLLYLFRNLRDRMTEKQKHLSDQLARHWIEFCYGRNPWEPFGEAHRWMIYGPTGGANLKTEPEDEDIRRYTRTDAIMKMGEGVYQSFVDAMDYVAWGRSLTVEQLLN